MTLDEFDAAIADVPPLVWNRAWHRAWHELRKTWPAAAALVDEVLVPYSEGLLARYLVHNHWTTIKSNVDVVVYSACMSNRDEPRRLGEGPTRFHALIAAVINVYHEEHHTWMEFQH